MRSEDLFRAMSEIDEELIEEAAEPQTFQAIVPPKHRKNHQKKSRWGRIAGITAAAAAAGLILLPNISPTVAYAWEKLPVLSAVVKVAVWRDYHVEEGNHVADVTVPQVRVEAGTETEPDTADRLKQSADAVNASVEELTDRIIAEFESAVADDPELQGMDSIHVGHEVVTDTEHYFSMKVWVTEIMGSGYEQDYYYTIDRRSGEIVTLAQLFAGDDDYRQTISAEIRRQMEEQMAADENVHYWLNETEMPEWNFTEIAADQSFYIDEAGRLVICFNEGDVAPMYMGCVTFEMPQEIWSDNR